MISLLFNFFNGALACDSVYLSTSFGEPTFEATTVRPMESCWSHNTYGVNSDMFVCDDDGNLRYLQ